LSELSCISIVIPTIKREAREITTLKSIARCRRLNPNMEVIVQVDMWGSAARARDEGAKKSKCPVIAFLDDDVEVECRLLERLARYALEGYVVILGVKPEPRRIPVVLSRLTVIRRDVYFSGCRFDGRIILNQTEDDDFILTCLERNYKILLVPPDVVGHTETETTSKFAKRLLLRAFNGAALSIKHPNLVIYVPRKMSGNKGIRRALSMYRTLLIPLGLAGNPRRKLRALLAPFSVAARMAGLLYYIFRLKLLT